jgi:penicillin amidase
MRADPIRSTWLSRARAVSWVLLVGATSALAADRKTLPLPDLTLPVEIVRDRWGISHIYAQTVEDMFFAQGFNAARDRLWQLDLWRRQGEGLLSEAFGARFVEQDRAARLFLFRGNLGEEFRSYHPEGEKILAAFTRGINAYVDRVNGNPDLLPLEFKLTRTRPGHWKVTSPLIRIFGLTRNAGREVTLARLVRLMGASAVEKVSLFEPAASLVVPDGLDLSLIDGRILATYNLARAGVSFSPEDILGVAPAKRSRYAARLSTASRADPPGDIRYESNNWAISGALTATGAPILAGDPHRAQSIPSLRYIAHINGPGWNVIGAGEPALPGISLGHNERIAYALTIFSFADEEDLYVYETNPANPNQYRYRGGWEEMRVASEAIPVRNAPAAQVQLKFTRHGPVLFEDPANHKAYALRAVYLEHPGTAVYLASLRIDQAQSWETFQKGMEKHYTPSENMVYADVHGNIGWFGGSLAPIRPNWNGLLPVPGDGRYEWAGYFDTQKLPRVLNPSQGFFSSANEYNLPLDFPFKEISGREWSDPFRQQRIQEVLSQGSGFTLQDSMRLQYDELSLPARALVPLLTRLSSPDADVQSAIDLLRGWDHVLSADSVPAAIYELWVSRLHANTFARYVPPSARSLFGSGSRTVLIRLLQSPDAGFGPDPIAGRDAVLLESLAQALADLTSRLGPDPAAWKWGALHHMQYVHALSAAVAPAALDVPLDTPRFAKGGDGFTVHNTGFRASDFRQTGGASYREVIDLSNWDNSFTLNSPGQSGDPHSPHYQDLLPLWARGEFVPMLYSREKVMEAAEDILVLEPVRRAPRP